jgi:hypothetical protein
MLRTTYNHLNKVQKGSLGEAFSKMAFTLEGFEVYDAEYDDRGIDFVVRNSSGQFLSVQVKATDKSVNPFIKEDKFFHTDDFLFCAVRLIEGTSPTLFLARGSDWGTGLECLHFNPSGGVSGPYYEMRFAAKYETELADLEFQRYVEKIRT